VRGRRKNGSDKGGQDEGATSHRRGEDAMWLTSTTLSVANLNRVRQAVAGSGSTRSLIASRA
jgi:hypothetical protein